MGGICNELNLYIKQCNHLNNVDKPRITPVKKRQSPTSLKFISNKLLVFKFFVGEDNLESLSIFSVRLFNRK